MVLTSSLCFTSIPRSRSATLSVGGKTFTESDASELQKFSLRSYKSIMDCAPVRKVQRSMISLIWYG